MTLSERHQRLIKGSAISPEVADMRGYFTAESSAHMKRLGFSPAQSIAPALIIPLHGVTGDLLGYQARPDQPRMDGKTKKTNKYETPKGMLMDIDVHPIMRSKLSDPAIPLGITEGMRKGDSGVTNLHIPMVSLLGVWNFRGTNQDGGKTIIPSWEYVALNDRQVMIMFDSDVILKAEVQKAMERLGEWLKSRKADVWYVTFPHGENGTKVGLDDFLAQGNTIEDVQQLCSRQLPQVPKPPEPAKPIRPPAPKRSFDEVFQVFREWLFQPDREALAVILATVVANRIKGDPVWLLVVSPPSSGKTEMIQSLEIFDDVHLHSRLTPAAFLSGTSFRDRTSEATGGILRQIGERGILVNKDFGSILVQHRDIMSEVLQALRDIYDNHYVRSVGTDGGRTLEWKGHCGFIGGTTDDFDNHHQVIALLGDRYLLLRPTLSEEREQGKVAIRASTRESQMRPALSQAVAGLLDHIPNREPDRLDDDQVERIATVASLVVRARSAVNRGFNRQVDDVPAPEQPARLAKQLARLFQALVIIGLPEDESLAITERVAMDSMPRNRRMILDTFIGSPKATNFTAYEMADRTGMARTTTGRAMEDLHLLKLLVLHRGTVGSPDRYALASLVDDRWPLSLRPETQHGVW